MKQKEFDENIISALKKLPCPLKTAKGKKVYFDTGKRDETIFEHIANKSRHLHIKDIQEISKILMDKLSLKSDSKSHKFHNYIGRRGKKGEKAKFLKIITKIQDNDKESIITIYTIRKRVDK